jgi:hypothetical protein
MVISDPSATPTVTHREFLASDPSAAGGMVSTTSVAVLFPTSFIATTENSSQAHSTTPSGAVTSTNVFIVANVLSIVSFEPLTVTVTV